MITNGTGHGPRQVRSCRLMTEQASNLDLIKQRLNLRSLKRQAAVARIVGQSVKVYDEKGRLITTIPASGAASAIASGDSVAISSKRGSVKVYDSTGRHRANIP